MKVKWRRWKARGTCGFIVSPSESGYPPGTFESAGLGGHLTRALELVAALESPSLGVVQSWDGAGMSGGIIHVTAIYPVSRRQGALWSLCYRMSELPEWVPIAAMLAEDDLFLDGSRLVSSSGSLAHPLRIRDALSGPNGNAYRGNERALAYAKAFHRLFAAQDGVEIQVGHARDWLLRTQSRWERQAYARLLPAENVDIGRIGDELGEALDFAMAVYHAFSVNAPSVAVKAIKPLARSAYQDVVASDVLSRRVAAGIIRRLGLMDYGRWHDLPGESSSRYDKTRRAALRSGRWSQAVIRELMPVDIH